MLVVIDNQNVPIVILAWPAFSSILIRGSLKQRVSQRLALNETPHRVRRQRLRQVVALPTMTAHGLQRAELSALVNTLASDGDPESFRDGDDAVDNDLSIRIHAQAGDK